MSASCESERKQSASQRSRSNPQTISLFLRYLKIGRRRFMELARVAVSLDPKLAPIIEDWDRMKPALRNVVDLDALCEAHEIDPAHFIAVVGEAQAKVCHEASICIAAMNMPEIVAASVRRALTTDGFQDRKKLFEHAGLLPVPGNRNLRKFNHDAIRAEADKAGGSPFPLFEDTVEED